MACPENSIYQKKLFAADSTFFAFLSVVVQRQATRLVGKMPGTNLYVFHHTKLYSHIFVVPLSSSSCSGCTTLFAPSQIFISFLLFLHIQGKFQLISTS